MSSGLFQDEWEDSPNRITLPVQPLPWLGSAMVWGPAQTQGSKRGFVHPHLKRVVIVDDNDKALKSWRQELVDAMQRYKPERALDCPVAVNVLLYVPRPQTHYRTGAAAGELKPNAPQLPAAGRDIDKVARAILDAGQIARWWVNDARVCDLKLRRRYDDGIGERTYIWAWEARDMHGDQSIPELDEAVSIETNDE